MMLGTERRLNMERYVIGQDFNTHDWFIFDNNTNRIICWFDTEYDAIEWLKGEEL